MVISGVLITLGVGGCKLYNKVWQKGYNKAFKKIETANERKMESQTREADSLENSAKNKLKDMVGCKGKECADRFDNLFKRGW